MTKDRDKYINHLLQKNNELKNQINEVIKSLPGSIYIKDIEGKYLFVNDHALKMVGLSSENEIIGKSDFEIFTAEEATKYRDSDLAVINSRKEIISEEPNISPEGKKLIQLSSKRPLLDYAGNIVGIIGNTVDITYLKDIENKLRNEKNKVEQVNKELLLTKAREERFKAMSALGGMLAHELRTPLASLKNNVFTINNSLPKLLEWYEIGVSEGKISNPIRKDILSVMRQSLNDMAHSVDYAQATISTVLAGFRHAAPGMNKFRSFSLSHAVQEALSRYPFTPSQRKLITFHTNKEYFIMGDEYIVIHVLHNLLKNALHAIQSVGKGEIKIWIEHREKNIILFFEDTAKGISTRDLPYIFDAFYTTKKKNAESIGLGLYFCKVALARMNSNIDCESEINKFTRFFIQFALDETNATFE